MRDSVLAEAQRLLHGDREQSYGHPADTYQCAADLWRAMIRHRYGVDVPLTPDFGCLMMVALKLARESGNPKRDNRVDGAAYFEAADMCLEKTNERE